MPTQAYRLRIRPANDTGVEPDALVITSIRGGTNPYIAAVPNGDGQEVDLLTGAVRTGAYVVEVADVVMGTDSTGTIRLVTSNLYDGTEQFLLLENGDKILLENGDPIEMEQNNVEFGRPHLLSRKAFLEMSTDGGSTWAVWQAGYLTSVRQVDAIRYAFTISNTRRVEQTKQIFTWTSALERDKFPQRGCVFGGPIIDGFGVGGDKTIDSRGWEFKFLGTSGSAAAPKQGDVLVFSYEAGYFAPSWERKKVPGPGQATDFYNNILPYRELLPGDKSLVGSTFAPLNTADVVPAYPRLVAVIEDGADTYYGSIRMLFSNAGNPLQPPAGGAQVDRWPFETNQKLFVTLDAYDPNDVTAPWPALPTVNTIVRVRAVARQVDETSPLYIDLHPVEIAKRLYELINVPVNATSVANTITAIGGNTRLALRLTQPQTMAEFIESALFGPFGFAARTNSANEIEFFSTRQLEDSAPTLTIGDADIVGDSPPPIFDLDEATVVTSFVVEQQTFSRWAEVDGNSQTPPPDGIRVTKQALQFDNADTSTFSTRVVEYRVPGMVHDVASFVPNLQNFIIGIAREGFDRFGRGAPSMEVQVLRTSAAAAAQIGDLVYLNAGYYPNKNYRIGESTVGPRVAQIVRRDEKPEGPMFKLVDAGVYNQPAIAPTITIAGSTTDPRRIAEFTITNAAALNNAADLSVAVEWATGASAPAAGEHGVTFTRYAALNIPTGAVALPPVTPGTTVYVRARTEQAGLFPSLWTNWQSVTLAAWSAPSSVTVTDITNGSAVVSWSLGGNTTDTVDVFVAPGSVAPTSWQGYRINSLTAGTTSVTISNLGASTAYIVGVAFRDIVSDTRGTVATTTFMTVSGTTGTALRPAGLQVIAGVRDASLPQGNVIALWPATGESNMVIERAPDSSGSPGTFADLATVTSSTTIYTDYLPRDGAIYWYRIRHETPGKTPSSPTPSVSTTASGIQPSLVRPGAVAPVVIVTTSETTTTGTVLITITDPQSRLQQVRFREQTNNAGWSAWTVDSSVPYSYTATLPATGFVEIEYEVSGYGADGVARILAAGVEAFDVDTIANIVSASGTFSLAGALTLAVQADSDTNSFKYAVATTNWASDAAAYTAAQAGTLVNARNATITLSGPYAVGATVYVAIAAYSGASASGTASGPYRYAFLNSAQDTIPLMGRARVTATTDTTITIRYAVACAVAPSPNTASIAYTEIGTGGVTPTSPQTVTPELNTVVTEAAGSYVDFTVTRPSYGSASGRVTFTVTATSRVADTDSVDVPASGLIYSLCEAVQTASTATTVTVQVNASAANGTPQVRLTALANSTIASGAALNTLVASGSSWTFNRPAFEAGQGQAEFEAVLAGAITDTDLFSIAEQGRDTVPLIARARVTASTATDVTVRVAVADPYPQGANSATIAYQTLGLGAVTPASGQTVTPQSTLTEAAGTYVDFTVPRPSPNNPTGRITFTATAANRTSDSDAVDVPSQDLVAPSLKIVTTPSSSSYSLVITWDGTIVYNLDGVSQSVSGWTSPRTETITRNDYLGATKVAAFAVTKNSITVSESVNVPPKDTSGGTITIGTQTADDTTDEYTFSWTASGFPSGTQYDLLWTTTTTAGVIEQGFDDNVTSPYVVQSGFVIGNNPKYSMTVSAVKDNVLILSKSRTGNFVT